MKKRDYQEEYARYHSRPEQIRNRSLRNQARRKMEDEGKVKKGDGKDVDHRRPLDRGGSNSLENLRVMSKKKNRGYRRDSRNNPV
jgi:5-methylcytosine-specific restriction endonuclease McrA